MERVYSYKTTSLNQVRMKEKIDILTQNKIKEEILFILYSLQKYGLHVHKPLMKLMNTKEKYKS